jgi:glycerol-3-phosphate dehydrogenase (NAD(P)+)
VLTATGALSRNRQVGLQLARGPPLAQALRTLGHVAEGVYSAPPCWRGPADWASRCRSPRRS